VYGNLQIDEQFGFWIALLNQSTHQKEIGSVLYWLLVCVELIPNFDRDLKEPQEVL